MEALAVVAAATGGVAVEAAVGVGSAAVAPVDVGAAGGGFSSCPQAHTADTTRATVASAMHVRVMTRQLSKVAPDSVEP
jgi:hypothetical protein